MLKTFLNVFKVPELRNKVLFTLFMLLIYRIGYHVTIPGADQDEFAESARPGTKLVLQLQREVSALEYELDRVDDSQAPADVAATTSLRAQLDTTKLSLEDAKSKRDAADANRGTSAADRVAAYVSLFSGGNLSQSTIFGLGVMPYISASIIMQLLTTVVPTLEKLQKEGETGRRKIIEWTRFLTIPLCLVQAIMWLSYMLHHQPSLVTAEMRENNLTTFWIVGTLALTAGSVFLMWVGEQIDEYGLGNGTSMIILAGIVARMPMAITEMASITSLTAGGQGGAKFLGIGHVILLGGLFVFIIAGSILVTQAQRRIPIAQAKHTRGRKVYGGQKQYLPLRVNHGGVMPIIFAQSIMLFPGMLLDALRGGLATNATGWYPSTIGFLASQFQMGQFLYTITELVLIYFFAYFWTTVQFQPKEMANQLRDYGSFIPGIRPGPRTASYLEKVMMHITYVGAAFLCVIAVIPMLITTALKIPPNVAAFLGGTGLLIVVSVALDVVQRIEANLLMRNYSGFLAEGNSKGKRIRGRQY